MKLFDSKIEVEVIQYIRPHGYKRKIFIEIDDEYLASYEKMKKDGRWISAEVLPSKEVALYIESNEKDFYSEVTDNGPEIKRTIEKMLRKYK